MACANHLKYEVLRTHELENVVKLLKSGSFKNFFEKHSNVNSNFVAFKFKYPPETWHPLKCFSYI